MRKLSPLFLILFFILPLTAQAELQWSGIYKIEANHINNSELDGKDRKKEYGLHHLVLKPKIVAADGLTIHSRLDVFNSTSYENSGLGQYFGNPPTPASTNCTDPEKCNSTSQVQKAEMINVTQLYLTYTQEFGSLIAGRAPLHFGLGITHNSGDGLFDHWMDTRDLVGYKLAIGNLYILPMYGKLSEGTSIASDGDDITDYMLQVQYENPESGWDYGVFYWLRKAGVTANDAKVPASSNASDRNMKITTINAFVRKESETFKFGIEAAMQSGDSGSSDASGAAISMDGFAVAMELDWQAVDSRFDYSARLGYLTGDDTSTKNKFEGYIFDRNYDVAFLMFNHQLGQGDFLGTSTNATHGGAGVAQSKPDVEAMSNAYYIDLNTSYHWSEKWSIDGGLTYAQLTEDNGGDSGLGYEVDLALNFSPNKRLKWINEVGLLFPGSAFESGGTYPSDFAYGLTTKAAISF